MASPNYRVLVTFAAQQDIAAIEAYLLGETSIETTARVIQAIEDRIRSLASTPARFRSEQIAGRSFHIVSEGSYTVYYDIDDEAVRVLRVLHGSRDREQVL